MQHHLCAIYHLSNHKKTQSRSDLSKNDVYAWCDSNKNTQKPGRKDGLRKRGEKARMLLTPYTK